MIIYMLITFCFPIAICILLYFLIIKKKICYGYLQKCPGSDVSLCVKSGTSDNDWNKMCSQITSTK